MRNLYLLIFIFSLFTMFSCSSNLKKDDVLLIIEKELSKQGDERNISFFIGDNILLNNEEKVKYHSLADLGLLRIDSENYEEYGYYHVFLEKKSDDYIIKIENKNDVQTDILNEIDRLLEKNISKEKKVTVKSSRIKVADVRNIYENKNDNSASATVEFEVFDKTPFWILERDTTTRIVVDFKFIKTSDGWILNEE